MQPRRYLGSAQGETGRYKHADGQAAKSCGDGVLSGVSLIDAYASWWLEQSYASEAF
jgi:hypothetical protein